MRQKITAWEGCKLTSYKDPVGIWTIGVGHTGPEVVAGMRISAEEADRILAADLARFESAVERLCPVTTQNQFDALVSFSFNVGEGNLSSSTLRRLHNDKQYAAACNEFKKWNKAGGKVLAGLTRRREGEAEVYAGSAARPTLRLGSRGTAVSDLQQRLELTADGAFGPNTEAAVKAFQTAQGLAADGVVGPQTWAKLEDD